MRPNRARESLRATIQEEANNWGSACAGVYCVDFPNAGVDTLRVLLRDARDIVARLQDRLALAKRAT